jgi:hypothetical protein
LQSDSWVQGDPAVPGLDVPPSLGGKVVHVPQFVEDDEPSQYPVEHWMP